MLLRLKKVLNTYTDEELKRMELWINAEDVVSQIHIDDYSIDLITDDTEVKLNNIISKEGGVEYKCSIKQF